MRVLELYSGIGGMHYAFQASTVIGMVVASADINTVANQVYKHNFPTTPNYSRNIESLTAQEISQMNIDCILMSPPCQPFTRVGLKKDSKDNRCSSLLHVLQLIPHIKTLKYVLIENVKGFESSQARNEVVTCLNESEFNFKEFILSPCQFGIPNSRHRYYLIAKKKGLPFIFSDVSLSTTIPQKVLDLLPDKINESLAVYKTSNNGDCENDLKIKHILEENVDSEYLLSENILIKRGNLLDIRTPESTGSCCFTKAYSHYVEGTGSVLCQNSDAEIGEKFKKLDKNEECSLENRRALSDLKLRYFTSREISRLMCFPESFEFPNNLTKKQRYRLLGNSINVHVVSKLIYLLYYEGIMQS